MCNSCVSILVTQIPIGTFIIFIIRHCRREGRNINECITFYYYEPVLVDLILQ